MLVNQDIIQRMSTCIYGYVLLLVFNSWDNISFGNLSSKNGFTHIKGPREYMDSKDVAKTLCINHA